MFESCYTPHDVAHLLRLRFGLPVQLVANRPAVVCGTPIGAVSMPYELGSRVLQLIGNHEPTPAVTNPRGTMWTFLVAGTPPVRTAAADAVTVHPAGYRVLLPMSDSGFGWRWAVEPVPGRLRLPGRDRVLNAIGPALESCAAAIAAS